MDYVVIMGGGRVGLALAHLLIDEGYDITLIESDPKLCAEVASELDALKDPSLIIYRAKVEMDGKIILTNGDQTDTILSCLKEGKTFEDALMMRTYEPDAPNFTPRISLLMEDKSYSLSIIKRGEDEIGRAHV